MLSEKVHVADQRALQHTATHCNVRQHTATHLFSQKNVVLNRANCFLRRPRRIQSAVLCSVLQHVAACCSVLPRVAACCSVWKSVFWCDRNASDAPSEVCECVAVRCCVLQRVVVCGSVLQCVALCCSVLQCGAVCCMLQFVFGVLHCLLNFYRKCSIR